MLKTEYIFANYECIVENYIASFYKNDQVFSQLVNDELNPNYQKLKFFFDLIDINVNLDKFYSISKAFISARRGEVLHLDYPNFKNVAHYVLDFMPEYWKHFRLVLKIYNHKNLIDEILNDEKIKIKLIKKKEFIDNPVHEHNKYIEFLCPEFQGRLISWGDGPLDNEKMENFYPINVIRNLLKENPELPKDISNYEDLLKIIKNYFLFTVKSDEDIPRKIFFLIFGFIYNATGEKHSRSLFEYYGDFSTDIIFKNHLNTIVDVFDLKYLIESISFCDNCCVVTLNSKVFDQDYDLEKYRNDVKNEYLLREAINWCESEAAKDWREFFCSIERA